jgi:DNA-binding transcriptional LysR family regulator
MKANNVTLRQLRMFIAVADHGSFVTAASALGLSQPALSQAIRQLEEEIGSPLFVRTTRRVQISTVGLGLLPQARHIVRQVDAMVDEMRDMVERRRGRIRVACLPSVAWRLMPPVLSRNKALFPGVKVVLRDTDMGHITADVLAGEADLGIGSPPERVDDLASVPVARDRMHVVFPRGHALEAMDRVPWHHLSGHPFVAMTSDTGIREIVDGVVLLGRTSLDVVAELSNLATVSGLVEEGAGISALPGLALPRQDHPALAHRPLVEPEIHRDIALIWRRSLGLSPAASTILSSFEAVVADGTMPAAAGTFEWLSFRADLTA